MRFEPFDNRYGVARDQALQVRNQGNGMTALVPSSDPRVLDLLGSLPAAAGVPVTADSAQRVAAVYACVTRIAGGISTLPCDVYARTWDARRREYVAECVEDAPLWWMLNEAPADGPFSAATHWEWVTAHRCLRGDHFTEIRRNNKSGTLRELVPMPWSAVQPERLTPEVGSRLMYAVNDGLRARGVDQDDMLHFPGFGFDGVRGRSVIHHAARNATGNALAMDEYSGKFFAAGAHPSVVLKAPKRMSPEQISELQNAFVRKYGGLHNAHQVPLVLTEGMTADPLSVNAEDSQLLDSRKFTVIEIARAFGVPPHMIGETSGSTSWGSGIESMTKAFVAFTLAPHLTVIEQEINRKLFRTARNFVRFDREALIVGDMVARAQFNRAAIGGPGTGPGWKTVNDVRHDDNLPPVDGGDTLYTPPTTSVPAPKEPKEPQE